MNVTDPIIHTALLGTAGKEFTPTGFPETLQEKYRALQEKASDSEDAFLQMAALTFAYHRAGTEPLPAGEITSIAEAPEDDLPYFASEAGDLLLQLLYNHNRHLLHYAYRKAVSCHKLLPPFYMRTLISHAYERTNPDKQEEKAYLSTLTGKRGRWLLSFLDLPDWGDSGNETWETASHEERIRMLCRQRKENAAEGLALLQTELTNESAAHRNELIRCLRINLSKADEPFLQEIITTDRSGYVRETARQLLSSLPDSELVTTYCNLLKGKLRYNFFLGWSYNTLDFTPEMKKLGLEEISSNKKERDNEFLLRQLAERVPLSFWATFFNCSLEKAASHLAKRPPFPDYFDVCLPISSFGDTLWAYETLKEDASDHYVTYLIQWLTPEQREEISFQTGRKDTNDLPEAWFNEDGVEWGMKFSTQVLKRLFRTDYVYAISETAERLALHFPENMLPILKQRVSELNNPVTIKLCRLLIDFMQLKKKINHLFNDSK